MKTKNEPSKPKKIGRPPHGDRALTSAEKSAAHISKLKAAGIIRVTIELPVDVHAELKRQAADNDMTIGKVIAQVVLAE